MNPVIHDGNQQKATCATILELEATKICIAYGVIIGSLGDIDWHNSWSIGWEVLPIPNLTKTPKLANVQSSKPFQNWLVKLNRICSGALSLSLTELLLTIPQSSP